MSEASKAVKTLDIVADPVCPWCFLGLESWKKTKATWKDAPTARFRPYLLYPDLPADGVDRKEAYGRKFPDPAQRQAILDALEAAAKEIGVDFDIWRAKRISNVLPAQHLISRTAIGSGQENLAYAILDAYWRDGCDIGDKAALVACAAEAGIPAELAGDILDEAMDATRMEADAMRRGGVDGVPTFIVNGAAGFAGALPPEKLRAAIDHAAELSNGARAPN